MKIDVMIPVYHPDDTFLELLKRLSMQTRTINRIFVVNTEEELWNAWVGKLPPDCLPANLLLYHVTKETFDHGGTRDMGIMQSDAEICICMTQDALPADKKLVERLTEGLMQESGIGVAYARQLPKTKDDVLESYTRSFNYPDKSRIKTKKDLPDLGIKTYFCSNVCAAYKRELYVLLGGFIKKTIFNEDMIFAAKLMEHGYGVAYVSDAKVFHSHRYTLMQHFRRNFDLAVSQRDHPEVFAGISSEGEGICLVKRTISYLMKNKKAHLIPKLILVSGWKYMGYFMGKRYQSLPHWLIMWCTMNKNYWKG